MADFLKFEFNADAGNVARVRLNRRANVMLLDSMNFNNYKNGRQFRYYGGHSNGLVADIAVPRTGHWYLVVDLGGESGHVSANVEIMG